MKKDRGITLIALVITIIVLLILAGVTIQTLTGDNGLLQKAGDAIDANKEATVTEKIQVEVAGSFNLRGELDIELLNNNLSKIIGLTYNGNALSSTNKISQLPEMVELEGYKVIINKRGQSSIAISDEKNYTGYYADIDTDGKVDGIIFADIVKGSTKGTGEQQWTNQYGKYTIPNSSNTEEFKSYYISKESYTWGDITNPILSSLGTGNDRFYIMSLEDFTTEEYTDTEDPSKSYPAYTSYYWYKNATGHMNPNITSHNFGTGKENTRKMIEKWNAAREENPEVTPYTDSPQDPRDIWKHIQTKYQEGWFMPSRAELSAFANELEITPSNYSNFSGLSGRYCSSSQYNYSWMSIAFLDSGKINTNYPNQLWTVRLATTF